MCKIVKMVVFSMMILDKLWHIRSGLSNLNHPRAAYCKSGPKAGRTKQNLGEFYRFSKEF